MSGERSIRLFVAVELPDAWKQGLAGLQERTKAALAADGFTADLKPRWIRPEGIHLTLKFIGEVEPERLASIQEALARAVTRPPGIALALGRPGTFADRRAPRVLWAGLGATPDNALDSLVERIEAALAALDVRRERRPFRPHLTLARLPDGASEAQRRRAAELAVAVEPPAVEAFQVAKVSLMQSFLGPGGARYERLATWPG